MVNSLHSPIILVVDDDPDVRSTISRTLGRDGYHLIEAEDGAHTLRLAQQHRPDLIILDISLSDTTGYDLCRQLRTMPFVNHTPVLFLSVHQSAQHVAKALDSGGDDYLRKPFVPRELSARVRALLRRARSASGGQNVVRLDPNSNSVYLDDRHIILTPTEYGLLEYLCNHQGEHHTANDLLEKLWNYPPGGGDTALVRNHIRNLRRKIEHDADHPAIIVSLHGRGYAVDAEIAYANEGLSVAQARSHTVHS